MQNLLQTNLKSPSRALMRYRFESLTELRKQYEITNIGDIVEINYPTLQDVSRAFGRLTAESIIEVFIVHLNDMSNVSRLLDGQIVQLKELLVKELLHEKLTAIHEFFERVMSGYYGRFYGALDLSKIMEDCYQFRGDMSAARERFREREAAAQRRKVYREMMSITTSKTKCKKPKVSFKF